MPPDDIFHCFTPYGCVEATFPDESPGVVLAGDAEALEYVDREIRASTNIDGISLTPDLMEPCDLVNYCQRASGLLVLAPPWFDLQ